ncbi:hypothetical protein EGU54_21975 [Achromobacter aegrifaciens]|nr:hypothetical protein EGU54_21975 [Achromobacter aegrifaciens]
MPRIVRVLFERGVTGMPRCVFVIGRRIERRRQDGKTLPVADHGIWANAAMRPAAFVHGGQGRGQAGDHSQDLLFTLPPGRQAQDIVQALHIWRGREAPRARSRRHS